MTAEQLSRSRWAPVTAASTGAIARATDALIATDHRFGPLLLRAAEGGRISADELSALADAIAGDPIQRAFVPVIDGPSLHDQVRTRLEQLAQVWQPFASWWRSYFDQAEPPVTDLWRLYLPFANWIIERKGEQRPDELFVVGFNGSPGAGKTVLTNALAVVLNAILDPETDGRAIARSGDDWYLGKAEREPLRQLGYDPGLPGVSNRSLPGTHDLAWLRRNLAELQRSDASSVIRMGNFDKRIDDQPAGADRYFEVRGKVGVLLFDLWFAGAETDVDPSAVPAGLPRVVAEQLRQWSGIFGGLDALWAYDWPSLEQMVAEREAQEQLVERRRGSRGMSRAAVTTFMTYMIKRAWDWRITSPIPPERAITFHAQRGTNHRVVAVNRGGDAR